VRCSISFLSFVSFSLFHRIVQMEIPEDYVGYVIGMKGKTKFDLIKKYDLQDIGTFDNGILEIISDSDEKNKLAKIAIGNFLIFD
jgi:polyribonucleotide nucleotidyltransferase